MSDVEQLVASYAAGRLSRRALARRLVALGIGAGFVETLLGRSIKRALAAPLPRTASSRGPNIVMVVMDGFRADYQHLAPMHHLDWLMSEGTSYPNAWVGQLESNTPPSHATLSTGAMPAHQGVIGFSWRDPATGQETYTGWYKDVIAGRLEQQLQQHGVNSIPAAVKHLDPTARVVAVSSEKYYAADAMGGPAADYILYGHATGGSLVARGMPHHVPPEAFLRKRSFTQPWPPRTYGQIDEMSVTMALESLRAFNPRVLMINLPAGDYYGHRVGGPATPDVMARIVRGCDRQLGRLIAELRNRGTLDQTLFVVTGDHGMVPNTHVVDDARIKQEIRRAGGQYLFHTGRNAAFIWLRNPSAAAGIAQHLTTAIPHAPFAHYLTIESGVYGYRLVTPVGRKIGQDLDAAYRYLLGTLAGPLAPDIFLAFEENTIITTTSQPHGEHSGATWGTQHVPLVIAGPGVLKGRQSPFRARLMDVAPTVLSLLGIEPSGMDGVVLADALLAPTPAQIATQAAIAPSLRTYQRAIAAQARADLSASSS